MNEELIKELKELPEVIQNKGKDLLEKRAAKDELSLVIRQQEMIVLRNIEAEYEETKDKLISSIPKRQAVMEEKLKNDPEYVSMKGEITKFETEIKDLYLEIEFLNNKFKAARSISNLIGGQ